MNKPQRISDMSRSERRHFGRLIGKALAVPYREDELARRMDILTVLSANPDTITLVFEEGDCDPPFYTRSYRVVKTPTLAEYLAWERAYTGWDGSFMGMRPTTTQDRKWEAHYDAIADLTTNPLYAD